MRELPTDAIFPAWNGGPYALNVATVDVLTLSLPSAVKDEQVFAFLEDLRDAPKLSSIYEALSKLYQRSGDTPKAEDMEARRLELWRHWERKLPNNSYVIRQIAASAPFAPSDKR